MSDDMHQRIEQRAREIWQREGRPDGRSAEHWRLAEEGIAREAAEQQAEARGEAAIRPADEAAASKSSGGGATASKAKDKNKDKDKPSGEATASAPSKKAGAGAAKRGADDTKEEPRASGAAEKKPTTKTKPERDDKKSTGKKKG